MALKIMLGASININIEFDVKGRTKEEICQQVRQEITSRYISNSEIEFVCDFSDTLTEKQMEELNDPDIADDKIFIQ